MVISPSCFAADRMSGMIQDGCARAGAPKSEMPRQSRAAARGGARSKRMRVTAASG